MFKLLFIASLVIFAIEAGTVKKIGRSRIDLIRRGPEKALPNSRALEVAWFDQKLDHFDLSETRTWQQRYFYSADTYTPGGPIFLFISGEWESDGYQATATFIGDVAAQHGGFVIDLEHRYYGQSRPLNDTTTPNLKYLNARQALHDAAVFTQWMMANSPYNLTGPWIAVGGSYSANLAAWARGQYPNLFYAAWASSGPVLAKLDFFEYYEVVNDALAATDPLCPLVVQNATNELDALIAAGDAATITTLFNFCETVNLANPDDVDNIYTTMSNYFAGEVQYARYGSLVPICTEIIAGQATPLATVANLVKESNRPFCYWSINQQILDFYRDDTAWYDGAWARQWFYQCCLEYGYWQTLISPNQPFGQSVPVEFSLLWCSNVYGPEFTREVNEAGIANTNLIYGGLNPDVERVLYTHGTLDPWSSIGIQTNLTSGSPTLMISGESHCRDIGTPNTADSQPLKDARIQIEQIIAEWISLANNTKIN